MIMFDQTKYAGIMRSEGAYAKVVLLLKALASCRVCVPERHIADILACDRTTVSRAGARIRRSFPIYGSVILRTKIVGWKCSTLARACR